jgi:hypothetical protein
MAIQVNDISAIDQSANANLAHILVTSSFEVSSNVTNIPPHAGTLYGYSSGGVFPTRATAPPTFMEYVDRFPFATDTNATNVAQVAVQRRRASTASSEEAGYSMSGDVSPGSLPPFMGAGFYNHIEKFNFATEAPATLVGNMKFIRVTSGAGCASPTHGYTAAARVLSDTVADTERFPFANEIETSIIGGLTYYRSGHVEAASLQSSYVIGGSLTSSSPYSVITKIEKYQFAAETTGILLGDNTLARWLGSGLSSPTHGYSAGGISSSPTVRYSTIDKISFASEGNATLVGQLTSNNGSTGATTSSTNGYILGGATSNNPPAPTTGTDAIDKFPFATDTNATEVADLSEIKYQSQGLMN